MPIHLQRPAQHARPRCKQGWTKYRRGLYLVLLWVTSCGGRSELFAGPGADAGGSSSMGGTPNAGGATPNAGSPGTGCTGALETPQSNTGLCVAKMAEIAGPSSSPGYHIDVTEVTQGQYDAWLRAQPGLPASSDVNCSWKSAGSYAPQGAVSTAADAEHHPIVNVDWCDAYEYCTSVGKRLCGAIGGGAALYAAYQDATQDQWYRACSAGGANSYPYGNTYSDQACNGVAYSAQTQVVGSLPGCVSLAPGYAGVYDMSGNAWEWEDSCTGDGATGRCMIRGGCFDSDQPSLTCASTGSVARDGAYFYIGFRCCAE